MRKISPSLVPAFIQWPTCPGSTVPLNQEEGPGSREVGVSEIGHCIWKQPHTKGKGIFFLPFTEKKIEM